MHIIYGIYNNMNECIYKCVYVCTYVCVCVFISTYVYICMYRIYIYICIHILSNKNVISSHRLSVRPYNCVIKVEGLYKCSLYILCGSLMLGHLNVHDTLHSSHHNICTLSNAWTHTVHNDSRRLYRNWGIAY